jgi:hypothetical protein
MFWPETWFFWVYMALFLFGVIVAGLAHMAIERQRSMVSTPDQSPLQTSHGE